MSNLFATYSDACINMMILLSKKMEKSLGNDMASIIYMIGSGILWFIMSMVSKIEMHEINIIQSQVFRGVSMIILSNIIMRKFNIEVIVPDRRLERRRILRNALGVQYNVCYFFMISKIPLSETMILQTMSTFMIAYLDFLINKTKYSKLEIILSIISFLGVILIIKPELFISGYVEPEHLKHYAQGYERLFWISVFLISIMAFSYSVIIIGELKSLNPLTLNYPFGILLVIFNIVAQIFYESCQQYTVYLFIKLFMLIGIAAFFSSLLYLKANQLGKPGKLGVLLNLSVVYSFIFEIFYLHETPSVISLSGSLLVIISSIILSLNITKK